MTNTTEIAPYVYRFSMYVPEGNLEFNQFLINDEEPVLFHTRIKSDKNKPRLFDKSTVDDRARYGNWVRADSGAKRRRFDGLLRTYPSLKNL